MKSSISGFIQFRIICMFLVYIVAYSGCGSKKTQGSNTSVPFLNNMVSLVAMSVGDEGYATTLQSPFEDLHRNKEFRFRFSKPQDSGK